MKTLYCGFKGRNNSSCQLLSLIAGEKLFLTNSFQGLQKDIERVESRYDLVIMFGLDKELKNTLRIERMAEYGGDSLTSRIAPEHFQRKFSQNGIESSISEVSGRYLCNAAYYHMLQKTAGRAVFIHIPTKKNMTEHMLQKIADSIQFPESIQF